MRPTRRELAVLAGILVLAALARLPGLAGRGRWNADQGNEMLVLHAFVRDGVVPLIGPPTQIPGFHHGGLYYWLLGPAAALSNVDPYAVALELALLGIAAVAATWWLGRRTGGALAAGIAGLLMAVSPAGIDNSTVIWNPSPVPLFAALAAVGVVGAHQEHRARWWFLAALGTMGAMQCHALAGVLVVPVAVAWILETLQARRNSRPLRPLLLGAAGGAVIILLGYVPLAVHELGSGFAETQALLAYLGSIAGTATPATGDPAGEAILALPLRVVIVGLRSLTWPVSGLITDHPAVSILVGGLVAALWVVAVRAPRPWAARWQVGTYAWTVLALAIAVPALATVTPQLPNDHYHSLLDPIVIALSAAGLTLLWERPGRGEHGEGRVRNLRRLLAITGAAVLVGASVAAWPPFPAYDEGFPAADAAAVRIEAQLDGRPVALVGIPPFKTAEGIEFPLVRRGVTIATDPRDAGHLVIECDPLFEQVVGAACGGPAERAWQEAQGITWLNPVDRFQAGPRRWISVYEVDQPAAG